MPTSGPEPILPIASWMIQNPVTRFLDIGCGNGKYGFLAREYLDIWHWRPWGSTVVDGIEIHRPYILPHHELIYDTVHQGDALDVLPTLQEYDLAVCSDVIEHLSVVDGIRLLELILDVARVAFVATPVIFHPQGAVHGNEHERHISHWTPEMLSDYGNVETIGNVHILRMQR
jgi:SAM-dependent methyltransferase